MSVEALATAERMIPSWTNGSSVQKTINFRNINDIQFSKSSNSLGLSVKLLTMKFLGVFLNKICQLLYNTDLWILRSYWSFHSRAVNYCTILTCGYFVHTDHSTQEPSTIVQYFWLVNSSFSTRDTRCVNLVTNPVISHEWGKDREVFTRSGTYPWYMKSASYELSNKSVGMGAPQLVPIEMTTLRWKTRPPNMINMLSIKYWFWWYKSFKKSLKIPKGQSESVYMHRKRTDNTMAKRKSTKGQTTINKNIHIKLKIE
jgi:hypothetical protein